MLRMTKRGSVLVFGADLVKQAKNTVAVLNRVVPVKTQLGGMAESHLFSQLGTQVAGGGVQNAENPGLLLLTADTADEDLGELKVGSGLHRGNSDELTESRVPEVMLDNLADFPADEGIDAFDTM
jgi:hypothetical protein